MNSLYQRCSLSCAAKKTITPTEEKSIFSVFLYTIISMISTIYAEGRILLSIFLQYTMQINHSIPIKILDHLLFA